jgi:4Fe-4S ferredoxin
MPLWLLKHEEYGKLVIERVMYTKRYTLIFDRDRCVGCTLCRDLCHTAAIPRIEKPSVEGEKATHAIVDVDEEKCDHCGRCEAICPFGAVTHLLNDEPIIAVVKTESFPTLIREVEVDLDKCQKDCTDCADSCPLDIIKVDISKPKVDIQTEYCPTCMWCQVACPTEAIHVRKIFNGKIEIHQEKCPDGCTVCLDVCPVNALHLGEDGKVYEDNMYCVYCGACEKLCPEPEALEIVRTSIRHTPIKSGAWNKALEKLTTERGKGREFRAKASAKAAEALKKRV